MRLVCQKLKQVLDLPMFCKSASLDPSSSTALGCSRPGFSYFFCKLLILQVQRRNIINGIKGNIQTISGTGLGAMNIKTTMMRFLEATTIIRTKDKITIIKTKEMPQLMESTTETTLTKITEIIRETTTMMKSTE